MKIDPYQSQRAYERWKADVSTDIPGVTPENHRVIMQFLEDMERGLNVAAKHKKGGRGFLRLNTLRTKLVFLAKSIQEHFGADLLGVSEEQLHTLFGKMRNGTIVTRRGLPYRATGDYVKDFKTFWHWHMRVARKQGREVLDVCADLDDSYDKPPWVYLTEADVHALCRHARFHYRALLLFLFDTGIRSPTELVNVRVGDLGENCTTLHIRAETSKTFGRTINLLLCTDVLRDYVRERKPLPTAPLFPIHATVVNRYLRRLATRVLGDARTPSGGRYSDLTMYDLRHSSACYWLPRYKSESGLKYRFGWKESTMIHYYTELLGMRDTITHDDLLIVKASSSQPVAHPITESALLEEELRAVQNQMRTILQTIAMLSKEKTTSPERVPATPDHEQQ